MGTTVPESASVTGGRCTLFPAAQGMQGRSGGREHQEQDQQARNVHGYITSEAIRYTARAATQATAHWKNTINAAQRGPSSRLTAAMAATQGV